jgi:glycosyltransferase involved in cell wall biosynthesis
MKVWMVCETLTELNVPNVTVLEIRRNLTKLGHEVLLFCPSTERKHSDPADKGVYFVPSPRWRGPKELCYQSLLPGALLLNAVRSRPDWMYVRPVITMVSPSFMGRLLGIHVITHFSGDLAEGLKSANSSILLRMLYGVLERINVKLSARVVVETEKTRANREARHKTPAGKIVVIPNGANTDLFQPADRLEARRSLGLKEDGLLVGFTGNLTRFQGVRFLVEAAPSILQKHPRTMFLIVGDGEALGEIKSMAEGVGLSGHFVFTGRVPYEKVPLYIGACDVCVAPRIRDMCEKTGISLLKLGEYMACARPVVASDIDGVGPVLTQARAGIPVPLEEPGALAAAIVRLLGDEEVRREMGRNGREYVTGNLTWEMVARRLVGLYQDTQAKRS